VTPRETQLKTTENKNDTTRRLRGWGEDNEAKEEAARLRRRQRGWEEDNEAKEEAPRLRRRHRGWEECIEAEEKGAWLRRRRRWRRRKPKRKMISKSYYLSWNP